MDEILADLRLDHPSVVEQLVNMLNCADLSSAKKAFYSDVARPLDPESLTPAKIAELGLSDEKLEHWLLRAKFFAQLGLFREDRSKRGFFELDESLINSIIFQTMQTVIAKASEVNIPRARKDAFAQELKRISEMSMSLRFDARCKLFVITSKELNIVMLRSLSEAIHKKLQQCGDSATKQSLTNLQNMLEGKPLLDPALTRAPALLFSGIEKQLHTQHVLAQKELEAEAERDYHAANALDEPGEKGKQRKLDAVREVPKLGAKGALLVECLDLLIKDEACRSQYGKINSTLRTMILGDDAGLEAKVTEYLDKLAEYFKKVAEAYAGSAVEADKRNAELYNAQIAAIQRNKGLAAALVV